MVWAAVPGGEPASGSPRGCRVPVNGRRMRKISPPCDRTQLWGSRNVARWREMWPAPAVWPRAPRGARGWRGVSSAPARGQHGPLPSGRLGGHPPVSSQWPPPRQRWEPPAPFIGNLGNRCQDSTWTLGSTFQLRCDFGAAVSSLGALSSCPGSQAGLSAGPTQPWGHHASWGAGGLLCFPC